MKIGGEFLAGEWPALRARLEAGDAEAWQLAVEILRSRLCGRYLDHSRQLLDRPYSGFAVLAIDCAVVEALEQFRRGVRDTPWKKGKEFFRAFLTTTRFKNHFPEETANLFYDTIRCGILHQAETKEDSLVKRKKESFVVRQSGSGRGLITLLRFSRISPACSSSPSCRRSSGKAFPSSHLSIVRCRSGSALCNDFRTALFNFITACRN